MNDPARRATRTLVQTSFAGAIIAVLSVFGIIHWTDLQTIAVMAVVTPLVGFGQNLLEDRGTIPALLKAAPTPPPPTTTVVPVPPTTA